MMLERLFDQTLDQLTVADATHFRLLGHKAQGGHSGLGVDFQKKNAGFALLVVPAEVGTRGAAAAEQAVRLGGHVHHRLGDIVGHVGRADMLGEAVRIFAVVVVEADLGLQLGDAQGLIADDGDGQFVPLDEGLC